MLASRSILALTATALLTVTGAMAAGAGPDQDKLKDLSVRVEIGDHGRSDWGRPRWGHGPRPVVIAPAPVVVTRPVVVVPAPVVIAETAPRSLDVQAFQAGDTVMILAHGENITSGFVTSLERESDWRNDGVARVTLHNVGPTTCATQACTPFSVSGGFETRERLSELRLCIAGQEQVVPVQRIERIN